MSNERVLEAIKVGMRGEADSVTTYENAAASAEGAVQDFFTERANEEKRHYNWLLSYYRELAAGAEPDANPIRDEATTRSPLITEEFLRRIGSSRQLSAAVSTAVLLEATSVRFYQSCAEASPYTALKDFYERLAVWEERHYHDLLTIQEESERYYWDANNWQPF